MAVREVLSDIDPDLVIQEATYGFVMALTLVTTAQLGIFTYSSRWDLILAIIGMDFVWGAIDMYIFYRVDILAYRRRLRKYIDVNGMDSISDKKEAYRDEFQGSIFEFASMKDREKILDVFVRSEFVNPHVLLRGNRHYILNSVSAFIVTLATVIPSVVALVIFADYFQALVCSSVISAIALFFLGYLLSPGMTKGSRIATGVITALIALLFTIFAAYFGG